MRKDLLASCPHWLSHLVLVTLANDLPNVELQPLGPMSATLLLTLLSQQAGQVVQHRLQWVQTTLMPALIEERVTSADLQT